MTTPVGGGLEGLARVSSGPRRTTSRAADRVSTGGYRAGACIRGRSPQEVGWAGAGAAGATKERLRSTRGVETPQCGQ